MVFVDLDNVSFYNPPQAVGPQRPSQKAPWLNVQYPAAALRGQTCSPSTASERGVDGGLSLMGVAEPTQQITSNQEPPSCIPQTTASITPTSGPPRHPFAKLSPPSTAPLPEDWSTTYHAKDPFHRSVHGSESSNAISDTETEAPEAATGNDLFPLSFNKPQGSSHGPRRCDEAVCQENGPCAWCTRFPKLSAAFKRFRKNCDNHSETSREAESLEIEVDPNSEKTVPGLVSLSCSSVHGSEDGHGTNGGQPPNNGSHGSDDTHNPNPLAPRELGDIVALNEEDASMQSLPHKHLLHEAGIIESHESRRCSGPLTESNDDICQEGSESTLVSSNNTDHCCAQHLDQVAAVRESQQNSQCNDSAELALAEKGQEQDKQAVQPSLRTVSAKQTKLGGVSTRQLRARIPKRVCWVDVVQDKEETGNARLRRCKRRKTTELPNDNQKIPQQQKRGRRSTRQQSIRASTSRIPSPPQSLPSPPSSYASDNEACAALSKFDEWSLPDAILKRAMFNGEVTFQLQFTWPSCQKHGDGGGDKLDSTEDRRPASLSKSGVSAKRGLAKRGMFDPREDNYLLELKERHELPWKEIYKRFTKSFPGRSLGALQVRYCTKLKGRNETSG